MKFKKKGGVVGDLISGTGGLIILTVIVLVIVSTLLAADLLGADSTSTQTVINETNAWINETGYTLALVNASNSNYALTAIWNATSAGGGEFNLTVPLTNASVSAVGVVTNNSADFDWQNVSLSYTFTFTHDNKYKATSDLLGSNLTSGIDNVSTKIPTILLIAAVVLLFGVIVLLVRQSGALGIAGGGASL